MSKQKIKPRNSINSSHSIANVKKILDAKIYQRLKWNIEDNLKPSFKNILGENTYSKIRNFIA